MILRTETVEQAIEGDWRATFLKEVVVTEAPPGPHALGMVRKRLDPAGETRGAVLLIHGFGQNRYTWHIPRRSFSSYLAARGWDVFNVDLRGHGRSRRFGARRPHSLGEYVDDDLPALAAEAMRLSGHDRVVLIGHSMGGLIAYSVAASSLRGRVRAIVGIGSPYHWALGSRILSGISGVLTALRFTGAFDRNPPVPLRVLGRHFRKRRALWDTKLVPMPLRAWAPGSVEAEVLDEYLGKAFDWASIRIAFDIFRWGSRAVLRGEHGTPDWGAAFELLDLPLLVIAGSHDSLAPEPSVRLAYDRSRASDKSFRTFPLGHIDLIVGREAPSTVWPTIGDWLERR